MTTTLGEVFSIRPRVTISSVDDLDAPPLLQAKFDLTPSDGAKALPVGDRGPQGPQGEPGLPIRFQGHVTTDDAIPDESILGPYDEGKAWANTTTGSIWLWDGDSFMEIPDGLGVPGPPGPAGSIAMGTTETSPTGGVADVEIAGSPLARTLNLVLPRGFKGPPGDVGPSGPIRQAVDYSNAVAPKAGDILEWDAVMGKWKPVTAKRIVGPWTLIDSDFSAASTSGSSLVVASLPIPELTYKYRLWVTGLVLVNGGANTTHYVEVVPQSTGLAVARGVCDVMSAAAGVRACAIVPYSGTKLTPTSTSNEMPANTAQVLNVRVVRENVSGTYNVASNVGNNIQVWLIPV